MKIELISVGRPDGPLEVFLRKLAVKYAEPGEWAEKYGATVDNDLFMMHAYCWCETAGCPWCLGYAGPPALEGYQHHKERQVAPNFQYKPTDFKVWWYKYIGRDMEQNRPLTAQELTEMERRLLPESEKR